MAARIIFCIEGIDACQYPSRVWGLAETKPVKRKPAFQGTTNSAFPGEGNIPYPIRCSEAAHAGILREAIREQADPNSTACFIVLLEDRLVRPVNTAFHVERVSSPDIQASFDDNWASLEPRQAKAA